MRNRKAIRKNETEGIFQGGGREQREGDFGIETKGDKGDNL